MRIVDCYSQRGIEDLLTLEHQTADVVPSQITLGIDCKPLKFLQQSLGADQQCVELKSLKLYFWAFREEGHFHEAVTNLILDDLVKLIAPRFMEVKGIFNVRGGIYTTVIARHGQPTANALRG